MVETCSELPAIGIAWANSFAPTCEYNNGIACFPTLNVVWTPFKASNWVEPEIWLIPIVPNPPSSHVPNTS